MHSSIFFIVFNCLSIVKILIPTPTLKRRVEGGGRPDIQLPRVDRRTRERIASLDQAVVARYNRLVLGASNAGLETVGEIRKATIAKLLETRNLGPDGAAFLKDTFAREEE